MKDDAWIEDGKLVYHQWDDVEPVLNHNKRLLATDDGWSPTRELRRAASIPHVVVLQWLAEGVDVFDPNHKAEVRRRLNSPDWAHLRTAPGRL